MALENVKRTLNAINAEDFWARVQKRVAPKADANQRVRARSLGTASSHGLIAIVMAFFLGCTSLTPDRVNLLAQIAGQAAQYGTQQWLKDHPDHRAAFGLVIDELQRLLKAGETNQAQYATNLNSLPTATLAGPSGELYVTEDRLVVWDAGLNKAVAVKGAAEQPVIRAAVAGLKRAMLPLPPMPPKPVAARARTRVQTTKVFTPTVALTNVAATVPVAPVSPGESDAAPPLQLSRTNVTRSVVDVTHNDGAASMVSVRWLLGPNSAYHVEYRNEGGTNWYRFSSLTNATATGQTNCCVVWPPTFPVGSWRVLRVR